MDSTEIQKRLKITYPTFQRRVPELIKSGMFKDGKWLISERDFNNYIENLKLKNHEN